ncbi:unnamed protein product [Moneuplotes crassus]|uniref:Uncharacterized protein n=1 Tax=Euplotes crassus TaxID=5936 RepID=A0AAD1UQI7_EUPCR|nr:unnamed protein product [Moneuplotes crassus]
MKVFYAKHLGCTKKKKLDELAMINELQLFKGSKNIVNYNNTQKMQKNKTVFNIIKRHKKEVAQRSYDKIKRTMKIVGIEVELDEHNRVILSKSKSQRCIKSKKSHKLHSILDLISDKHKGKNFCNFRKKDGIIDDLKLFVFNKTVWNSSEKLERMKIETKRSTKMEKIQSLPLGKFRNPNIHHKSQNEYISNYRKTRDTVKERMLLCKEINKIVKRKKNPARNINVLTHGLLPPPSHLKYTQTTTPSASKSKYLQKVHFKQPTHNTIKTTKLRSWLKSIKILRASHKETFIRVKSLSINI